MRALSPRWGPKKRAEIFFRSALDAVENLFASFAAARAPQIRAVTTAKRRKTCDGT
jgi:hypothetical protein